MWKKYFLVVNHCKFDTKIIGTLIKRKSAHSSFQILPILLKTIMDLLSNLENLKHLQYFGNVYCYDQPHWRSVHVRKPETIIIIVTCNIC